MALAYWFVNSDWQLLLVVGLSQFNTTAPDAPLSVHNSNWMFTFGA